MVFAFFVRHTSSHSLVIGDDINATPTLGFGAGGTGHVNQPLVGSAIMVNLQKDMQDLCDRIVSTCVTMVNQVYPTLDFMTMWTTLKLPHDPDAALICAEAVTLFHIIGTEFARNSDTRNKIY
jgi:hypothetical protein